MRRLVVLVPVAVAALAAAAAGWALQAPGRTQTRGGPITSISLTHASVAFAVGRTATDCDHVELWNPDVHGTWRLGRPHPCGDLPVFSGIGQIGVASGRVVWISFAGGNHTDWQLWTATVTKKTPKQLAFVERDTSDAPAMVVGAGIESAVPYAIASTVTLLGENGAPVFKWTAPAEVRAVTAGVGPYRWTVAVLLANGDVAVLDHSGGVAKTYPFAPGQVRWLALAPTGLLVQVAGAKVQILRGASVRTVQLRPNAIAVDYAEGRLLYRVGQSFWLRHLASGDESLLLQGSRKQPIAAALDTHGLTWSQGPNVNWVCAVCISP